MTASATPRGVEASAEASVERVFAPDAATALTSVETALEIEGTNSTAPDLAAVDESTTVAEGGFSSALDVESLSERQEAPSEWAAESVAFGSAADEEVAPASQSAEWSASIEPIVDVAAVEQVAEVASESAVESLAPTELATLESGVAEGAVNGSRAIDARQDSEEVSAPAGRFAEQGEWRGAGIENANVGATVYEAEFASLAVESNELASAELASAELASAELALPELTSPSSSPELSSPEPASVELALPEVAAAVVDERPVEFANDFVLDDEAYAALDDSAYAEPDDSAYATLDDGAYVALDESECSALNVGGYETPDDESEIVSAVAAVSAGQDEPVEVGDVDAGAFEDVSATALLDAAAPLAPIEAASDGLAEVQASVAPDAVAAESIEAVASETETTETELAGAAAAWDGESESVLMPAPSAEMSPETAKGTGAAAWSVDPVNDTVTATESSAAVASSLLDAELDRFSLAPEEVVAMPTPIPGLESLMGDGVVAGVQSTGAWIAAGPSLEREGDDDAPESQADVDLRAFVARSQSQAHILATLEAVARRVRGGEIVPTTDAGASPEAVLASVLSSLLSARP
ncbi:MAG: hypothetical protein IPJ56_26100 [Gemmatimonadetes bacterium]|nr:hypothetical protein [Gemmatimonadota bacterium]